MRDSDWQILYELYQTPNVTKAANRLYMSQPSLSKRLQIMEAEFQVKIVERTSKGIVFTKEGKILVQSAQEYMKLSQRVQQKLRSLRDTQETIITLGFPYSYSEHVLTDVVFPYTQQEKNIRFEIKNDASNSLFYQACDGDVDVAFVRGDYENDDVKQYMVEESQAYVLTRDKIRMEDLPDMPRLSFTSNDRTRSLIENWWFEHFKKPIPDGFSAGAYIDVAWKLASKGLGYVCCFVPEDFENTYNLQMMPMLHKDGSPITRKSWLVYRKEKEKIPELKKFIQYMKNTIVME